MVMKAYVTSIGEPTTDLCIWSLERLGFEVILIASDSTLANKLETIFTTEDDDFVRVDADVVVNKNVLELINLDGLWWYQAQTFGWHSQDVIHGGIQFVRAPCITYVRQHLDEIANLERPESHLFRLEEFHNPRLCGTFERICGIHGYGQDDLDRIKAVKTRRRQLDNYDFELAEAIDDYSRIRNSN